MLAIVYLLFSNVLWPIYVPIAVWLLEPHAARRKTIIFSIAAGAMGSLLFLVAIVIQPVSAMIDRMHIRYDLPHPYHTLAFALYAAATCLAPLLSSHRLVRLFGVALIGSMAAAYLIYSIWFASVWCYFAALLSVIVLLHFWIDARHASTNPSISGDG